MSEHTNDATPETIELEVFDPKVETPDEGIDCFAVDVNTDELLTVCGSRLAATDEVDGFDLIVGKQVNGTLVNGENGVVFQYKGHNFDLSDANEVSLLLAGMPYDERNDEGERKNLDSTRSIEVYRLVATCERAKVSDGYARFAALTGCKAENDAAKNKISNLRSTLRSAEIGDAEIAALLPTMPSIKGAATRGRKIDRRAQVDGLLAKLGLSVENADETDSE